MRPRHLLFSNPLFSTGIISNTAVASECSKCRPSTGIPLHVSILVSLGRIHCHVGGFLQWLWKCKRVASRIRWCCSKPYNRLSASDDSSRNSQSCCDSNLKCSVKIWESDEVLQTKFEDSTHPQMLYDLWTPLHNRIPGSYFQCVFARQTQPCWTWADALWQHLLHLAMPQDMSHLLYPWWGCWSWVLTETSQCRVRECGKSFSTQPQHDEHIDRTNLLQSRSIKHVQETVQDISIVLRDVYSADKETTLDSEITATYSNKRLRESSRTYWRFLLYRHSILNLWKYCKRLLELWPCAAKDTSRARNSSKEQLLYQTHEPNIKSLEPLSLIFVTKL